MLLSLAENKCKVRGDTGLSLTCSLNYQLTHSLTHTLFPLFTQPPNDPLAHWLSFYPLSFISLSPFLPPSMSCVQVIFLECICDDMSVIERNSREKIRASPDYSNMSVGEGVRVKGCCWSRYWDSSLWP